MIGEILQQALHSSPHPISTVQFHEWKQNTVTKQLFSEMVLLVLEAFEEPLPEDQNKAMPKAFLREGGLGLLTELWEWKPANLIEEDR